MQVSHSFLLPRLNYLSSLIWPSPQSRFDKQYLYHVPSQSRYMYSTSSTLPLKLTQNKPVVAKQIKQNCQTCLSFLRVMTHEEELARDAEMAARENESKKRKTRVLVRCEYINTFAYMCCMSTFFDLGCHLN
jgi:hypothetical protein